MSAMLARYRAVLCDLDGCLVSGETVLPGAQGFIERAGARLEVLSNNSTDTAASLSMRLARGGLVVAPERIVLAGVAAIELVARRAPGGRVFVCGSSATVGYAAECGLQADEKAPEYVILTRDTGFSYRRLQAVLGFLKRGARLVVANADATHPGADGVPVPETGALLAAVRECLPGLSFEVIGKPEPALFLAALGRLGVSPGEAVLIGDNPATDGAGAKAAGVDFIQIGDGVGARFRDLAELVASGC
ncbi:MAG TPA: HAD family hydrolase [Thermohalobaculum sp.]|nr:HAD family hydrolase [Thermohalobaculum sp.]